MRFESSFTDTLLGDTSTTTLLPFLSYSRPHVKQLPLAVLTTTVYSTLVYIMAGLNTDGFQYGYFVLVMVLCNLVALSFCQVRPWGVRTAASYMQIICLSFLQPW